MSNFTIKNGVLENYKGKEKTVQIPKGVTEIAEKAFSDCSSLVELIIPEGVKKIGN